MVMGWRSLYWSSSSVALPCPLHSGRGALCACPALPPSLFSEQTLTHRRSRWHRTALDDQLDPTSPALLGYDTPARLRRGCLWCRRLYARPTTVLTRASSGPVEIHADRGNAGRSTSGTSRIEGRHERARSN